MDIFAGACLLLTPDDQHSFIFVLLSTKFAAGRATLSSHRLVLRTAYVCHVPSLLVCTSACECDMRQHAVVPEVKVLFVGIMLPRYAPFSI